MAPLEPRRATGHPPVLRLAVLLVIAVISGVGVLLGGMLSGQRLHVVFGAVVVALGVASGVELWRRDRSARTSRWR
jgi:uncharacterized membrane protein HdeD (DUF308 family)